MDLPCLLVKIAYVVAVDELNNESARSNIVQVRPAKMSLLRN